VVADQYLMQRSRRATTAKGRSQANVAAAPLERANAE
jgi:ribose transport system permease protein